uniref:Uncharacterized protein n=1 Tax=Anguilla anguilla TaxID=7936 RepID=A0A0E9R3Q1_ANGAN
MGTRYLSCVTKMHDAKPCLEFLFSVNVCRRWAYYCLLG